MCIYEGNVYLHIYIYMNIVSMYTWQSWLSQPLNVALSDPISAAGSATVLLSAMFPA